MRYTQRAPNAATVFLLYVKIKSLEIIIRKGSYGNTGGGI